MPVNRLQAVLSSGGRFVWTTDPTISTKMKMMTKKHTTDHSKDDQNSSLSTPWLSILTPYIWGLLAALLVLGIASTTTITSDTHIHSHRAKRELNGGEKYYV
mmetsp:Transcript_4537/g.7341  ORF Transcript_4537/g.7341 Transcript_4537/m.7341 type:complete len:102 (-) Transcript_4537:492-797(-)